MAAPAPAAANVASRSLVGCGPQGLLVPRPGLVASGARC